jgi:hypothetical protein
MKLQRFMPLRYWYMLALILVASIFVHFQFGDPFRLPVAAMVIVAFFGFFARYDRDAGSQV